MAEKQVPLNPYIAGSALDGPAGFFGREDVLRLVETELRAPQQNAVVLFGQRRIGKTSILLQLRRHVAERGFLPIYLDLMDRARRPLGAVLADLAGEAALELGLEPPEPERFADLWKHLDGRARTAATVLCLGELQGRVAGREYDVGDIDALERYRGELRDLEEHGLVELWQAGGWQADWGNWVFWRGEHWRVSSRRLVWWVSDQVLAREAVDWDAWLDARRYGLLLTHQEMETLQAWATKIPKSAISSVTKVIGLLIKELLVPGS